MNLDIGLTPDQVFGALEQICTANGMVTDAHARLMIMRGGKRLPLHHPRLPVPGANIAILMDHSKPKIPLPVNLAAVPRQRSLSMTRGPRLNSHSKLICILDYTTAETADAHEAFAPSKRRLFWRETNLASVGRGQFRTHPCQPTGHFQKQAKRSAQHDHKDHR